MKLSFSLVYVGIGVLTTVAVVWALVLKPSQDEARPEATPAPSAAPAEKWHDAARLAAEPLGAPFEELKPLQELKRVPQSGDWLLAHDEPPQTWADFHKDNADVVRGVIFVQPLGELAGGRARIVAQVADYMHRFFGIEVRLLPAIPLSAIPAKARRKHPTTQQPQLNTSVLESDVLLPRRPADAVAYVVFTAEDLFPEDDWNYVFGEAYPDDHAGLWSLARYGDPDESPEAYHLCLSRAMSTAAHETAHLLGIHHCQAYECVMNGANSLEESDRHSALLCPVCLKKLISVTGQTPAQHFEATLEFFRANGFHDEASLVAKELAVVQKTRP